MSLRDYTDAELRAELARRRAPACNCGPFRREYVQKPTAGFTGRVGCLTCNTWDDARVYLTGGRTT
jgi:hypothetical protein